MQKQFSNTSILRRRIALATASALALGLVAPIAAQAQAQAQSPAATPSEAAEPNTIEEIVVTSGRRESTVLKSAGSITAITGEQIQARGITDFSSLAGTIPALSFATSGPGQTEFELRGVSSPGGNSPTVGFYLDDTPLTAAANSNSGKVVIDPSLYDINRVEVLRGPQGSLYGSSSMGGTIKIITNQPELGNYDASGAVTLSGTKGGGFNHNESAMVNLPLGDKAALRLVGTQDTTSGWVDRIVVAPGAFPPLTGATRGDVAAAPVAKVYKGANRAAMETFRATLLVKPTDNLSITPSLLYQHATQDGTSTFDTNPGTLAHYQPYDLAEPYRERFLLGNLNVQLHTDHIDFTSNTADFSRKQRLTQDNTEVLEVAFGQTTPYFAGPAAFNAADSVRQFSQEFRATSVGDTRFKWIVGAFYSDLKSKGGNQSTVAGLIPIVGTDNLFSRTQPYSIEQSALFGEMSYQIAPKLKATLGLRGYHYDTTVTTTVSGVASVTGGDGVSRQVAAAKDSGVNPKFDLTYIQSENLTLYATAAKGFRPGGGNQEVPTNTATTTGTQCVADLAALGLTRSPTQYGPDSLWSYELGAKSRFLDRRLTLNGAVYQIDWSGIQQGVSLSCGFGYTANAGKARIRGAELELNAVLGAGLRLDAGVGYIDGRLTQGDPAVGTVDGQALQTVPKWTANVGLSYTRPLGGDLSLVARAEYTYTGDRANGAYLALTPTPAYDLTNVRIGLTNGRWSADAFVDNLFNEQAVLSYATQQAAAIPLYDRAATNQPMTAGLALRLRY